MGPRRSALGVLVAALVAAAATPTAAAGMRTRVTVFRAFTATGAPSIPVRHVSGKCFTASLTSSRVDAWRCIVGNDLYDPCFSTPTAPVVVCPASDPVRGTEIRLTSGLPVGQANHGAPSVDRRPWAVKLFSGAYCTLASGALSVVDGLPGDYYCGAGRPWLWGSPRRTSEPWTIFSAPLTAHKLSRRVAVEHAWT